MKKIQEEAEINVDEGVQLWEVDNNLQTEVQLKASWEPESAFSDDGDLLNEYKQRHQL